MIGFGTNRRALILSFLVVAACAENETWVSIDPIQCQGNPWESNWVDSHPDDDYPRTVSGRIAIFKAYYAGLDLPIEKVEIHGIPNVSATCDGCDCSTGERYYASILAEDVDAFIDLGFIEEAGPS